VPDLRALLEEFLSRDLLAHGHGRIYSTEEIAASLLADGYAISSDAIVQAARTPEPIRIRYRGGNSSVPVTFEKPNRTATLHQIDGDSLSFDTELAVQRGTASWLRRQGYLAKCEVPDRAATISEIARTASVAHLPDETNSRNPRCRDIMAQDPTVPRQSFLIVEAKGRTQLEADFYETFGQVFPITDPAVTRGWTFRKVPKHGWAMRHAKTLLNAWDSTGDQPLIRLVVLIPDFPPTGSDCARFFGGGSAYYPNQVEMFRSFVRTGDIAGDHPFARLLRHLRDEFDLLDMLAATSGLSFQFWGYQSLSWVRDFATNQPVQLTRQG